MYFGIDLLSWGTLAVLLVFAFDGMRRGLIKTVFSMLTIVIAIVISSVISPYVSQTLENTPIYDVINHQVEESIFKDQPVEEQIDYENTENQTGIIENLPLPEMIKESLAAHNNIQGYEALGVAAFKNYVLKFVTGLIINALSFVIILVLTGVILNVLAVALHLISYLPVLHTLNRLGGFLAGLVNGVVILWILGLVITIFGGTEWGAYLYKQVQESLVLSIINENNLLLKVLGYVKTMIALS